MKVYCPDCSWEKELESGADSFPYYCPAGCGDRIEHEIETNDYMDMETKTDKI